MTRIGGQHGPDISFLGVEKCDLDDPESYTGADVVIVGAPFDGGTSHRAGARFGPKAIRMAEYLEHNGSRPSLALRTDGLKDLKVLDAGDIPLYSGDVTSALAKVETEIEKIAKVGALPIILGGDHTIAYADATALANVYGKGRIAMIHFDAHPDTADVYYGSLWGHGTPMRRLLESGAVRSDRFVQLGIRGYWPPRETLHWMAREHIRGFEMTEIGRRGITSCLDEAYSIVTDDCDGVFLSIDIDVCDPGFAPGTGTPEPGGFTSRQLLDMVRRTCLELRVVGLEVVEVSPPYDHADITASLANRVVLEAISAISRRRIDQREGTTWNPDRPMLDGLS